MQISVPGAKSLIGVTGLEREHKFFAAPNVDINAVWEDKFISWRRLYQQFLQFLTQVFFMRQFIYTYTERFTHI